MQFKGKFITIEGIDGCGKSTLAQNLTAALTQRGASVLLTKEPGGSELGKILRQILQEQKEPVCDKTEYLLFAADRAQHYKQIIKPALEQGKIVISDRWADSSVAYQGYGRGLDIEIIQTINAWATEKITPDLVLYIHIDAQTALTRIKQRNLELTSFEKEKMEFWKRVEQGYKQTFYQRKEVISIDGTMTQDQILQEALKHI